jgi:predicted RNase H-like HicB family nuclease
MMKQIKVTLELGKDGYGIWFDEIPNVFGFGETVEAAKQDAKDVLEFFIHTLKKCNQPIPEILRDEYELVFEFNIEALLNHIEGTVTKTALAKASGINPAQLSHYSSGLKKPREAQRKKIVAGLHKLGRELLSVS